MKRLITLFTIFTTMHCAQAQITGPDTVCLNTSATFTSSFNAASYMWSQDTITEAITGNRHKVAGGSGTGYIFNYPNAVKMVNDNGQYHAFVTNVHASLNRLDFGANPFAAPAITYFPNSGYYTAGDIDVVKDPATGNWHGVITNGKNLLLLNFGTSLTSNYTITPVFVSNALDGLGDVILKKYNNNWLVFATDGNTHHLVKVNLGTSLANPVPVTNFYHDVSNYSSLDKISLHEENGNWYMFSLSSLGLVRIDLGNDLLGNTASFTTQGTFSGLLNYAHELVLVSHCDQLFGVVTCDNRKFVVLDFNGSITNTPVAKNLGYVGPAFPPEIYNYSPFIYGGALNAIGVNGYDSTHIITLTDVTGVAQGSYIASPVNLSFSTPGLHTLKMTANLADHAGSKTFCKDVYVRAATPVNVTSGPSMLTATAGGVSYQWNLYGNPIPGATGATYSPIQSGDYSVTVTDANGCANTSGVVQFTPLSIADVNGGNVLQVYPNPATGIINITTEHTLNGQVTISCYNVLGVQVYRQNLQIANGQLRTTADLTSLPPGVYELKVQAVGGKPYIKRIILQ